MAWVVEMTGRDPVAGQLKTVLFALGPGIPFTDADYAPSALMSWSSASQRIDFNDSGEVEMGSGAGEVQLSNLPDTIAQAGPLDYMADWIWQNQAVRLFWVEGRVWADRILMGAGMMEQPVENLAVNAGVSSVMRVPIRDPRAPLDTPLQPTLFAGTAVGPVGVEGGLSLKGKPKPILYGLVSNFSPPLVNESLLVFQIADKPVNVLCVRDGGVPVGAGTLRANLNSLMVNAPLGGTYDAYRGPEGTFIKLGTRPVYGIACDADESPNVAGQSHAQIWSRIRAERVGGVLSAGSIAQADALDVAGAGFYWSAEITQKAALDEILRSFSGYEIQNLDGSWSINKMVIPSGAPVVELTQLTPTTRRKATTRSLRSLTKVRPRYASAGAPPFRINLNWGRNYTLMDDRSFAGVVGQRLRTKFGTEYRTATISNPAIWDPESKTGQWPSAPELTIRTAYQPGADGLSDAPAQAEATRIMTLLGALRGQYQTVHTPDVGEVIQGGDVVRLTYPRSDLQGGKLFRVVESGLTVDRSGARRDMVIGLQA